MIFGTDREFPPLYGFGWTPHRRVHFRYDDTHPMAGSHHQKIVVIDDASPSSAASTSPRGAGIRPSTGPTTRAASRTASPTRRSTT